MRRALFVLAAVAASLAARERPARALAGGTVGGSGPSQGSIAYTANEASDSVSVIDLAAGAPSGSDIAVGDAPWGLALSPAGDVLYVTDPSVAGPALQYVSTSSRTVLQTVPLTGTSPRDVAATPDGTKVYVAMHGGLTVSVVDVATHTETKTISVPALTASSGVTGLALTPDGTKLYVVNDVDSSYSVISTALDVVSAGPTTAPTGALRARVAPAGDQVMIVGSTAPVIVATATGKPIKTSLAARGAQSDVAIAGTTAFVANSASAAGNGSIVPDGNAAIDVYDLSTETYVTSFSLGNGIQTTSIVASPDGLFGWVACLANKGSLQGLDLANRTERGAGITTGFVPRTVVAKFPVPETALPSYFLPTSVKVKLKAAGKDSLSVAALFDEGAGGPDYSQPVTVTVAGYARTVTMAHVKPGTWQFKDATTKLVVKPKLKGSSRGSWTLAVSRATLSGVVPTDGDVDLSFAASGFTTATARAHVAAGAFKLGKVRGSLATPPFFPSSAKISLSSTKPDSVSLKAGFAADGATPAALGTVTIAVGPVLSLTVAGASFVKKGDVFKYATKFLGGKASLTIDFGKGTVALTATGVELGALAGPTTDVVFDPGLGTGATRVTLRLASSGTKRTY